MNSDVEQNHRMMADAIVLYARERLKQGSAGSLAMLLLGPIDDAMGSQLDEQLAQWRDRLRLERLASADQTREIGAYDVVAVVDGNLQEDLIRWKRVLKRNALLLLDLPVDETVPAKGAVTRMGFQGVTARSDRYQGESPLQRDLIIGRSDGCVESAEDIERPATTPPASPRYQDVPQPASVRTPVDRESVHCGIVATVVRLLQLSPGDLDTNAPFTEVGVDSIVSVALVKALNAQFGTGFQPTVLFDYSNVERLATHIAGLMPVVTSTAAPTPESPPAPIQDDASGQSTAQPISPPVPPRPGSNDIAIIGCSGRFPGAEDVEQFWENLAAGRNGIVEAPPDRWDSSRFYDPNSNRPDRTNSKWGGYLGQADLFDPLFFSISGREAEVTDPQQRVFLEESYHALENAGYAGPSATIAGKCGVFVGVEPGDYIHRLTGGDGPGENSPIFQGNAESILAARISYHLDLKGPAIAINTACSSSLVAIHLACQNLLNGECDMALAGGVRVLATEKAYLALGNMGMLSPEGQCKTFDDAANGFVPGEGVGVLVLKPMSGALRDGDHVHAVIRGSAINQDGRTNGITAPSSLSQTQVELEAYEKSGVSPESIQYVEAHGTGTRLGDPIEVEALTQGFQKYTSRVGFCAIGSVKTNIGHGMAAAGVSAVIKVLLSLRHGKIPPLLNFKQTNSHIDFEHSPFFVNTELREWPEGNGLPRRAAVSSFGFSGTNSHLVLEQAPASQGAGRGSKPAYLFTISAKTPEALQQLLERFSGIEPRGSAEDTSFTLNVGRGDFDHRCAVVAASAEEFRTTVAALAEGGKVANAWLGDGRDEDSGNEAVHEQLIEMILKDLPTVQGSDSEVYRKKLSALAGLYVKGNDLNWTRLHQGETHRRVPLPGYPFARERYWISAASPAVEAQATALHPLIHRELPRTSMSREFATTFSGSEFFLDGHQVAGERTLPGAAYLEMAIAASKLAGQDSTVSLSKVAWMRPLVVDRDKDVHVRLTDNEEGSRFEVLSDNGGTIHADGLILPGRKFAERRVDLDALRARCTETESGDSIAAQCAEVGLKLGDGFRGLRDVWFSDDEALSLLELPDSALEQADRFMVHPILLDGALQTTAALGDGQGSGVPVPFAIEEARFNRLPPRCYAHVRRDGGAKGLLRFHIDLIDESGLVVAELKGMAMRALPSNSGAGIEAVYVRPEWVEAPAGSNEKSDLAGQLLLFDEGEALGNEFRASSPDTKIIRVTPASQYSDNGSVVSIDPDSPDDFERLIQSYPPDYVIHQWSAATQDVNLAIGRGMLALFYLTRSLIRGGFDKRLPVLLLHPPDSHPAFPAVAGYARTLRLERPNLVLKTIESATPHVEHLISELQDDSNDHQLRWRDGVREIRSLGIFEPEILADLPMRTGGVYLITGGSGGLGSLFSRYFAVNHNARIAWMGRFALSPEKQAEISELESLGAEVVYVKGDVTIPAEVASAVNAVKSRFGALHGIIHAAGIVHDSLLLKKEPDEFKAVLSAKVHGCCVVDEVTRDEPLDFFFLFSSIASVLGNIGQIDYAYANAFLDEFSHWRDARRRRGERSGTTLTINWPSWRDGGMKTTKAVKEMWIGKGYSLMDEKNGLNIFEAALRSGENQVVALLGDGERIRSHLAPIETSAPTPATAVAGAAGSDDRDRLMRYLKKQFSEQIRIPVSRIEEKVPLEKYGIDSIMVIEFTQRLEKDFGELSRTLLFEYQNLAELGDYFLASHSRRLSEMLPPTHADAKPVVAKPKPRQAEVPPARSERVLAPLAEVTLKPDTGDIAIIGVFGRYPKADDLERFWENLRSGRDCIEEIPKERWDYRLFFDPKPGQEGKTVNKWGGFLNGVENFDPRFFSIMPREAFALDPQERLFLETVWRTVEDAGYRKATLAGREIGVFVGVMYGEYQLYGAGEIDRGKVYPLSSSYASIANRVSYFFDWHGPSIALDTMCSSSLSAIHLACSSLKSRETELAIAGGVNTTLHPHKDMLLSPGGFAASDGRCRSFGEGGDGYVPGEGVGAVLLKPLDRAIADSDHIHGVIKSTAVNHGGKTNGYTVPNPKAQAQLIHDALVRSKLDPQTINYIEAHGTGTSLGDPIEIAGMTKAFRRAAKGDELPIRGCAVGSVKSNIGHLESAAGIAGVTKVLLQMRHGQIAPSLHSTRLNPNIKLGESPFFVPQQLQDWKPPGPGENGDDRAPLRAGVSSFGAGGANAHVILEEFLPADRDVALGGAAGRPFIFVLSAKSEDRLRERARQLLECLAARRDSADSPRFTADVAYTLQVGREAFEERLAFVASDLAGAAVALRHFVDGTPHAELFRGTLRPGELEQQPLLEGEEGRAFFEVVLRQKKWAKLAQMWAGGASIEWESLHQGADLRRVPLPTYPFAGERFWAPDKLPESNGSNTVTVEPGDSAVGVAESLFLRPRWIRKELDVSGGNALEGNLLLFSADAVLKREIEAAFPDLVITQVLAAERFAKAQGVIRVNPAQEADYERLADAISPDFIFHSWACDESDAGSSLDIGVHSIFSLARALIRKGIESKVRLLFCHPLDEAPEFAGVAAFGKSLAQEQPLFELQTVRTQQCGYRLLSEWGGQSENGEIRWVGAQREVRIFESLEVQGSSQAQLREQGVYWITGGLGGLGRIFARHLAGRFNARLVLMGRSALNDEMRTVLQSLEELGGEILYIQGDITRREDALAAAEQARDRFGRIHGVIHTAGLIRDAFILKKEMEQFSAVLAPKIHGAEALDEATRSDNLDFFALFSSMAGAFGNAGQADYAFANGFLDSFSILREERRAAGQRQGKTVSINWPLWKDGGMQIDGEGMLARLQAIGIHPIPSDVGLSLFEQALQSGEPQIVPLWGDRSKLLALFTARQTSPRAQPAKVASLDAAAMLPQLESYLAGTLSAVTGLPVDDIDVEQRFDAFGVDSIVVNDFNLRLDNDFGALPKTLLYEQPNIRKLAEHLLSSYQSQMEAFFGPPGLQQPATTSEPDPTIKRPQAEPAAAPKARSRSEPDDIAIIGLSGRYPQAENLQAFWEALSSGKNCVTEIPRERWDIDAFFDPDPEKAIEGKMYCRWGAFLDDVDRFDPLFFNIAPVEAELMDPQERLFLEITWHALEDAGYSRKDLGRWIRKEYAANVGVFVGVTSNSYVSVGHDAANGRALPTTLPWSLANRVSFLFNFTGPSLPVDTACSASSSAIHLACEAIRRGECQQAIAGGVNLYLHPSKYSHLCMMKMLSSEGKCRAFGEGGDGFAPGEGVGAVLLKPLSLALEDGDHIHGVVKSTAINHGGRTNGYTVPNPDAQAEVIANALKSARIDPRSLGYIEAHGTGTALGDPIEVAGLTKAFASTAVGGPVPAQPCALGSVKTNIGHLESAAGIAGLTKVLLQMKHRTLAPSLHAETLNSKISFEQTPFRVQTDCTPWEQRQIGGKVFPRRAGISSFGAGGANAHIVVEEFVAPAASIRDGASLIVISAKNRDRLKELANSLSGFLVEAPSDEYPIRSIAFTLQVGREAFEERAAFIASDRAELLSKLMSVAADEQDTHQIYRGRVRTGRVEIGADASAANLEDSIPSDLAEAAKMWVAGSQFEWRLLYEDEPVGRLSLPGYPFARERYWIQQTPKIDEKPKPAPARLHPLIHRKRVAGGEVVFETVFDGSEPVVRDHQVGGRKIMPGAATLEMAMAAFALSGKQERMRLRNVVWSRPVVADGGVDLRLCVRPDGAEAARMELTDGNGAQLVQSLGDFSDPERKPGAIDWAGIEARCPQVVNPALLYEGFSVRGLDYGEGFQAIRTLAHGESEFWAELETPSVWEGSYRLHPALLDGALQSLAVIGAGGDGVEVPFEVREVECFRALPAKCRAHGSVESDSGGIRRYEITLGAESGEVLARLKGLAVRRYETSENELFFARPAWSPSPLSAPVARFSGTVLLMDEDPQLIREFIDAGVSVRRAIAGDRYTVSDNLITLRRDRADDYERLVQEVSCGAIVHRWSKPGAGLDETLESGIASFHRLIRALANTRRSDPLSILYVHADEEPAFDAVGGYVRSLRREEPQLILKTVAFEGPASGARLIEELTDKAFEIRYRNGNREERRLVLFTGAKGDELSPKSGGIYLITGGAGGLGLIFAEFLVNEFDARVLLVGRSELAHERVSRLQGLGEHVAYFRADVGAAAGAEDAVRQVKELYGRLDGVLHAAGDLRDGWIRNKSDEDFELVLAPKIRGVNALDAATRTEALDWFVLFSSTAGLLGNAGQADYAYANAYLDAFARSRNERVGSGERLGRTCSINWPLWADGGMPVHRDAVEFQSTVLGLQPLSRADGVKAFLDVLKAGENQCAVFFGNPRRFFSRIERTLPDPEPTSQEAAPSHAGPSAAALMEELKQIVGKVLRLDPAVLDEEAEMAEYGFDSITLTSLSNQVNRAFDLETTPAVMFEYQTLRSFGDYLIQEYPSNIEARFPSPDGPQPAIGVAVGAPEQSVDSAPSPIVPVNTGSVRREPIAVVGMGGVFPGSPDVESFWKNLDNVSDLIARAPVDRWDFGPEVAAPWGGWIEDADMFDSLFFDISPREAELMDPQQRLFLETVWKTIEDAGYRKTDLAGSRTGLFVGVAANDYGNLLAMRGIAVEAYSATGNSHSVLANRVSYFFDLRGPSEAIDTACSSSLVAIHRAIESIESGSSEAAIVGGVNLLVTPGAFTAFEKAGMLCEDGRCKTFDEQANGYVRGEGVGAILLKPLSQALRDGDSIYGLIRGSAENHGGRMQSLTVPNPNAQAQLLSEAFARAGVDPCTISYIEAHGTGTPLGDPIEINGLKKAFGENTGEVPDPRCAVGAVKTNIGHLETAAGIAGIIKVLLAMRNRRIPGNVHFRHLNPYIKVEGTPFYFPSESASWEPLHDRNGQPVPRRAGVSSFGFGGTNAHVVLEEFPQAQESVSSDEPELIVLSGRNERRLNELAENLLGFVRSHSAVRTREVAFTLQLGREPMQERLALIVSSAEDLVEKLEALLHQDSRPTVAFRGNTAEGRDALELVRQLGEQEDLLQPLLRKRDLEKLARLWIAGADIPWRQLHEGRNIRKVSLPTYPFDRKRHWPPAGPAASGLSRAADRLHPLVHRNISTFRELKYYSQFSGGEVCVRDHVVDGRRVMPGAAILELMLVGLRLAGESQRVRLKDVVWQRPMPVEGDGVGVTLALSQQSADRFNLELRSADGEVLAKGAGERDADLSQPETADLAAIRSRCTSRVDVPEAYAEFATRGLEYGEGYRAIRELSYGPGEVLSRLEIPGTWGHGEVYHLHPALADGALQSLAFVRSGGDGLEIPFAVDEVSSAGTLPDRCWAYGRLESETGGVRRYSVSLLDEEGGVLAKLNGLVVRRFREKKAELLFYRPVWRAEPLAEAGEPFSGDLILLDENTALADELRNVGIRVTRVTTGAEYAVNGETVTLRPDRAEDYEQLLRETPHDALIHGWSKAGEDLAGRLEQGIHSLHRLTRALLMHGRKDPLPVLFVYPPGECSGEAVGGYAKSLRQEQPRLFMKTVAIEDADASLLLELAGADREVRWIDGRRQVRRLEEFSPQGKAVCRPGGVYLISGGAGGLGSIFAKHLVESYDAKVVLAGRSKLSPEKRAQVEALGENVIFLRCDVSIREGAEALAGKAKEHFGRIDGVIHAAGILRDGFARSKTEEDFAAVLQPKILGAVALDEATRDENLDFFVMFSSSVGLLGNAGQSDYAFANAWMDAFARTRNRLCDEGHRHGRSLSINWPLWKDGGMRAPAEDSRGNRLGVLPLDTLTGFEIFDKALACDTSQVWGCLGDRDRIRSVLLETPPARLSGLQSASSPATAVPAIGRAELVAYLVSRLSALTKIPASEINLSEPLEKYGFDSMMAMEFSSELEKRFGELSRTLAFEYPSIELLANYLIELQPATAAVNPPMASESRGTPGGSNASGNPANGSNGNALRHPSARRSNGPRAVPLAPIDYAFVGHDRLAIKVLYYFEDRLDFSALMTGLKTATDAFYPVNSKLVLDRDKDYVIRECLDDPDFAEEILPSEVVLPDETDQSTLRPFQVDFDPTRAGEKLAKFRLHQLGRGSILNVNISHAIADGYSFYYFMSAWASACRGERFLAPDHTRYLLSRIADWADSSGNGGPPLALLEKGVDPTTTLVESLSFDGPGILAEAKAAAKAGEGEKLTENSVLTAMVWKHYARSFPSDAGELTLACPINFRRNGGNWPHSYFGNASAPAILKRPRARVLDSSVARLAAEITSTVSACNEDTLIRYNAAIDDLRRTGGLEATGRAMLVDITNGLVVTNVARFPLPPMDFGSGPCGQDFNAVNYAGTAVIVAGAGSHLKVRVSYPEIGT